VNESDGDIQIRRALERPPQGYFVVVPPAQKEDMIDVSALVMALMASWKLLLLVSFAAAVIAALVSLQLPKTYVAQALITPVTQNNGALGSLRSQFGGLAALTGIDLGSGGGRREESLATLTSTGFAREFIQSEKLMPVLFAEEWDASTGKWRAGEKPPSMERAVKKLSGDVVSVSEDKKTGLITVAVEWSSPELAARWANRLVELVNERLRSEATRNAERSIEFLNKELAKTSVVELRQAIYHLIEDQVNNAMLANVQREYAFRVIDTAVPPETRTKPRRTAITLAGAVFGLFSGVVFVLLRQGRKNKAVAVQS
jgi:uncharacterized protein involved in exopolysaccharide biosynthesis